jgi:hypothetical protein
MQKARLVHVREPRPHLKLESARLTGGTAMLVDGMSTTDTRPEFAPWFQAGNFWAQHRGSLGSPTGGQHLYPGDWGGNRSASEIVGVGRSAHRLDSDTVREEQRSTEQTRPAQKQTPKTRAMNLHYYASQSATRGDQMTSSAPQTGASVTLSRIRSMRRLPSCSALNSSMGPMCASFPAIGNKQGASRFRYRLPSQPVPEQSTR